MQENNSEKTKEELQKYWIDNIRSNLEENIKSKLPHISISSVKNIISLICETARLFYEVGFSEGEVYMARKIINSISI